MRTAVENFKKQLKDNNEEIPVSYDDLIDKMFQRDLNQLNMNLPKMKDRKLPVSDEDHIYEILDNRKVVAIDEVYIFKMGELLKIMEFPNLKKATFHMDGDLSDLLVENSNEKYKDTDYKNELFIRFCSCIEPSFAHYCEGIHLVGDEYVRSDRTLANTDFTFIWCYGLSTDVYQSMYTFRLNDFLLTCSCMSKKNGVDEDFTNLRYLFTMDLKKKPIVPTLYAPNIPSWDPASNYPIDKNLETIIRCIGYRSN